MSELTERLRNEARNDWLSRLKVMFAEAADKIEELEKQVASHNGIIAAALHEYRATLRERIECLGAAIRKKLDEIDTETEP